MILIYMLLGFKIVAIVGVITFECMMIKAAEARAAFIAAVDSLMLAMVTWADEFIYANNRYKRDLNQIKIQVDGALKKVQAFRDLAEKRLDDGS